MSRSHDIEREAERWRRDTYDEAIRLTPERARFVTDVGIEVAPLYTPADLGAKEFDYLEDLGFPGEYPFTRGDSPTMNRTRPFAIGAYSGFGEASDCNKRFKRLIALGVDQISIALDLPTQCGYDSDHEMATAEIGTVGVAIDTLADMEILLDGIAIEKLRCIETLANSLGPIAIAMFAVLGEKRGLSYNDYVVKLQNDPLKEYIARGTQILPAGPAAKLATDVVTWCVKNAPHWLPMTVCVNHINAGGAGSTKGTAIAFANALYYIDLMLAQGFKIDEVAPLLHMFPDERHDFFVVVANMRAMRRIWARSMRERYGATTNAAMALRTTVYGHGQETLQEPINNLVRIGYGTLAYVLGGASYVYIASYDEAVSTPSDEAVRAALRTQQIIANEHGFTSTIDPLGGSYFVEALTAQIEVEILDLLKRLEDAGGAMAVIDAGIGRKIMTEGAVRRQKRVDDGELAWVTVNVHPQKPDVSNTAFRINPYTERRQCERLARIKEERNAEAVTSALAKVDAACAAGENLVPSCIEAVKAYATVGEIVDIWRRHYGLFTPSTEF
jgi:methylmalonyl-CoA mutase N-terminal domain/subunit